MSITLKHMFNEKLEWLLAGDTLEEQVRRALVLDQMDPTFTGYIRMACNENERITSLPEGMPDTVKLERDLPDGIADSTARNEYRRIVKFQKNGQYTVLSKVKRESLWLQILEAVHPKEADMLTLIKDQELFDKYPVLFDVMEGLGASHIVTVSRSKGVEEPAPLENPEAGLSTPPEPSSSSDQTEPSVESPKKRGRPTKSQ